MSVTVDHEQFSAQDLGFSTIGQVLTHIQGFNRLVVNLLIDGEEPDFSLLGNVRRTPLDNHSVYIETADPRDMALEVLGEVETQLHEAERLKNDAVDLLQRNNVERALQKLSGCFSTWNNAQESVLKTTQLLKIDLESLHAADRSLAVLVAEFTEQLRQMKSALENHDYVLLADILIYETTDTNLNWRLALDAIRDSIGVAK